LKTIVSHFYNEEYLLPFWLEHHKKYFDHGIMINYASTDNSVNIIKNICPDWEIFDSENEYFEPMLIDIEVMKIEERISDFKITLNTTEFLVGDLNVIPNSDKPLQIIIPCHMMVDTEETEFTDIRKSLIKERKFGILQSKNNLRSCRSMHNFNFKYSVGRHLQLSEVGNNKFYDIKIYPQLNILYYGLCPMNEITLQRKLQIKNKLIPNPPNNWDYDHRRSRDEILEVHREYQKQCEDLSSIIDPFIN
jgi:hypothetical protein